MKNKTLSSNTIDFFEQQGYVVIAQLLNTSEVQDYLKIYNAFLNDEYDTKELRSDLSGSIGEKELITQIMRPSKVVPALKNKSLHKKSTALAKQLMGNDMALDFDMLINKPPLSNTPTPWHQDAAYWINLPDKRALSIWVALDEVTLDNGCMWYTPKSHLGALHKHWQINNTGALECQGSEKKQ